MKKILLGLGALIAGLVIGLSMQPSVAEVKASAPLSCDSWKIAICHKSGGSGNYTANCVDKNGLNGHGDHSGDIIPSFSNSPGHWSSYSGKNWNATGQAIKQYGITAV